MKFPLLSTNTDPFLAWLVQNIEAIQEGKASYDTYQITRDTEVTQYSAAFSFIILSIKVPSRFYILYHHPTTSAAFVCTLLSLVFGWWGFPAGPI